MKFKTIFEPIIKFWHGIEQNYKYIIAKQCKAV